MTNHLNDDQIAAVVAGLELEPGARAHLDGCVGCRRALADFEETVARQVASRAAHARVANVADPNYTVVATFPRRSLPPRIG